MVSPSYLLTVLVIIGTGIMGGVIAYLWSPAEEVERLATSHRALTPAREVLTGIGAAAVVPLFLHLAQSPILDDSLKNEPSAMLAFAGFCVLAAVSGRQFLARVGKTAFGEDVEARRRVQQATDQIEDLREAVVSDVLDPAEISLSDAPAPNSLDFSGPELEVVTILSGGRRYRTQSAIENTAKSGPSEAARALRALSERGFAGNVSTTQGPVWFLTLQGRSVVAATQREQENAVSQGD